jgi:hypothetical protein
MNEAVENRNRKNTEKKVQKHKGDEGQSEKRRG